MEYRSTNFQKKKKRLNRFKNKTHLTLYKIHETKSVQLRLHEVV